MQVTDWHCEVLCVQQWVHSVDIRHVCKSWKSSESSRDGVVLKHNPPPPILWHFPIKRRGCAPPLESGLSACLTQTTAEFCSASLQKLYQFLGPGLKKLAVSTSCLLGRSLLESSYRAVEKPKWPCGKTQAQRSGPPAPPPQLYEWAILGGDSPAPGQLPQLTLLCVEQTQPFSWSPAQMAASWAK